MNVHRHPLLQQAPYGALDIKGVTAQSVHSVHGDGIAFANIAEESGEAGSVGSQHGAAHPLVAELTVEAAAEGLALRFDALVARRHSVVSDAGHKALRGSKGTQRE